MACDRNRQCVSNSLARALFVFVPSGKWQRHPDWTSIYQELDVRGIGVPRSHGDNQRLIDAVDLLFRPAVVSVEVAIHGSLEYINLPAAAAIATRRKHMGR